MVDFFLPRFSMRLTVTREVNGRECLRFNFIYVNLMCLQHFVGIFLSFSVLLFPVDMETRCRRRREPKSPKQNQDKKNCTSTRCANSILFFFEFLAGNKKLPSEGITIALFCSGSMWEKSEFHVRKQW